jgi:hypothetical protein
MDYEEAAKLFDELKTIDEMVKFVLETKHIGLLDGVLEYYILDKGYTDLIDLLPPTDQLKYFKMLSSLYKKIKTNIESDKKNVNPCGHSKFVACNPLSGDDYFGVVDQGYSTVYCDLNCGNSFAEIYGEPCCGAGPVYTCKCADKICAECYFGPDWKVILWSGDSYEDPGMCCECLDD